MATSPPIRRHSDVLHIRVTPEHGELVRQAAERAGVSLSDWIRERLIRTARKELAEK
jgi:predicted HicB family RNase H-like nuclease